MNRTASNTEGVQVLLVVGHPRAGSFCEALPMRIFRGCLQLFSRGAWLWPS